jgi:integrase/recombinase XerD
MNAHDVVLRPLIEQYLSRQHSLGRDYRYEGIVLTSLGQFLFKQRAVDLDQIQFDSWCCHCLVGVCTNHRRKRQQIVRKFCLYRQRTEPTCFVPDASRFPHTVACRAPVVFGEPEIVRMLAAAEQLRPTSRGPLRPAVLRLAVVLLYTAGLRIGELARLTLGDADVDHGVLRIRESKFHKSRFVPLSTDARQALQAYLKQRLIAPLDSEPSSPLFCSGAQGFRGYSIAGLREGIQKLFLMAKVRGSDGRQPRVHDMRHVFALQALLRWYRQGTNVQSQLPKLAMYMGHVSIASTAYYLKWIPALGEVASQRFEAHYGHLIEGGTS